MKRYLCALLVLSLAAAGGCSTSQGYWISGPYTGADSIHKKFDDKVKIGMLRADVEKEFGAPSDVIPETDQAGNPLQGSRAAWLLYKYDYPDNPLLITIKVDYLGIVTEKFFDDKETVATLAAERKAKEQESVSYPGAPQRRFQELLKIKHREGTK